ncbi:NAD-dependent malic enzyme [bacterium]|nr:NAD-dependent malic enzyme [bacterium]
MGMITHQSSYTITIRISGPHGIGLIHRILGEIAAAGGMMGAIDVVEVDSSGWVRDFTVHCNDPEHEKRITEAVRAMPGIHVLAVSDETFRMHLGGKLTVESKLPIHNRAQLSMAYTPGVGRVSRYIADDPQRAWSLTIKAHTVAVVSDGSAVLGLGDIGPEAAMPVMEGKAQLFKEFGGVDAFPLCVNTRDPEEIIRFCELIAPTFGGINLEDISAPRCFQIERELKQRVDIPVFHDDQHGTAVVLLAAAKNALKLVGKEMQDIRVVVVGVGAAGVACSKMMLAAGVRDLVGVDRHGIICEGADCHGSAVHEEFGRTTNPRRIEGSIEDALRGADLLVGLSSAGAVRPEWVRNMAKDPIVFTMANPVPEVMPEEIEEYAAVVATGRSDYPNQINNVLAFPGIFRGALDAHATDINEEMKLAAAEAIAACVDPKRLSRDYIIPSLFNKHVAREVTRAVVHAAHESGVAQRRRKPTQIMPKV